MPTQQQLATVLASIRGITERSPFYAKKFAGIDVDAIDSWEAFHALPFTEKADLRDAYPLGLQAVPEEEIVRIHSSSGTTGTPVIIPYTAKDVDDWAIIFARCYEMAGVHDLDRVHVTPGYGLWTAGIGFQAGAERVGAMVVPMGPGNTDKQIQMMMDLKTTVLCATSSYALLLAEEIERRGIGDRIHLRIGIIGSERWGDKMRKRIANEHAVQLYDIYGLTEIYGPGVAMSCEHETGMHYWDDYVHMEVVDPVTGEHVAEGEIGELVITTLVKEGAPLIRYRTHDLTRFMPGACACGSPYPRIDTLVGRTDDMVKVKGVNIFPAQIDEILREVEGASSEFQIMIDHLEGRDLMTVFFEVLPGAHKEGAEAELRRKVKDRIGLTVVPRGVEVGDLPRSEKKTPRVFDNRY